MNELYRIFLMKNNYLLEINGIKCLYCPKDKSLIVKGLDYFTSKSLSKFLYEYGLFRKVNI